jgi:hypothetical protein
MSKAHERLVELVFVADDSAETVVVSEVNYYRTPADTKYPIKFTQDASQTTGTRLALGELLPPPTHILLTFTVVP